MNKIKLKILRRVGWVMIITGLIDTGFLAYDIINDSDYSFGSHIVVIVAGIFLLKGSLGAALLISWMVAFLFACFFFGIISYFALYPLDLLIAYIKLGLWHYIVIAIPFIINTAVMVWTYIKLTSSTVREAMDEAGINKKSFWRKPSRAFWIGGSLVCFLLIILHLTLHGTTANEAKLRATTKVGSGYKLYVTSINIGYTNNLKHVYAKVTAYNDKEIKDVIVEWTE